MKSVRGQVDSFENTFRNPVLEPAGYIDAHCHLADPRIDEVRDSLISHALDQGISGFIQGGVEPGDWDRQLSLSKKNIQTSKARWYLAFGLHPWWVASHSKHEFEQAMVLLPTYLPQAIALGELGLDHGPRCSQDSFPLQLYAFQTQFILASQLQMPVILHIVKAHALALEAMKATKSSHHGGIIHSFSGTPGQAKAYIDHGFHISIGSGILRKGFENLKRTVVSMPLESLVVETDAPDQAPAGSPNNINQPVNLWKVAQEIATLRGTDAVTILNQSRRNLCNIFKI